ncbi:MAG: hypothetical protein GY711_23175 [bacterium]|nr:hypothetical protein [bacterium]
MDSLSRRHARRGRMLFELPLALILALAGVYFVLRSRVGDGGLAFLEDHQVLVRVDNLTGELEANDRPGAHTFVPWVREVHRLDRRPLRYLMGEGGEEVDRRAPSLIVRGRESSSFFFGRVEIQAALDPARAGLALIDHGGERETMLQLVDAYSRPALRSAFGRFTAREIVLPANKQAATEAALENLTAALGRHGVRVLELSVSKPRFPQKYQEAINRRKVAEQDTERLVRERDELSASTGERAESVRTAEERKLLELQRTLGDMERLAQREADAARRKTDLQAADQLDAATVARDGAVARAQVALARNRADAAAFQTRLDALESQGELAVRAALVERLGSITFDLVPYHPDDDDDRSRARRTAQGAN